MTHHRIPRRDRGALSVVLIAGVLLPTVSGASPTLGTTRGVDCVSGKPGLADKLSKDILAALRGRESTTAVAVRDRTTDTVCSLRGSQKFDSASVVKVTVLSALLWDAQKTHGTLTKRENKLSTAMITESDNEATTTLWNQLGPTKIKGFLKVAGMTQTTPGEDGYWGLTQVTAHDEERLLALVTARNSVLSDTSRRYVLDRMGKVVPSQRWGVPAGAPASATVQLKNGWLERSSRGWRVHSIGAFTGKGHDYQIAVLTDGDKKMNDGVNTIQAVAKAVHKDLNPA